MEKTALVYNPDVYSDETLRYMEDIPAENEYDLNDKYIKRKVEFLKNMTPETLNQNLSQQNMFVNIVDGVIKDSLNLSILLKNDPMPFLTPLKSLALFAAMAI